MSGDMPARMSEDMSDRMSEDMPDRMSEDMPERMSEDMSDRMSEDGFKGWQTAGLDAHKKPWMCGLGVPVGCRKHAKGWFKRPRRSH